MIGLSRKRFISSISREDEPKKRLGGTISASLIAMQQGINIHRVHDVPELNQSIRVFEKILNSNEKKYFGTDGIRGTAYEFPINKNFLFNLAKAIKITFNDTKRVLIGMDTRESCELVKDSIISGFKFCNVDCDSLGIVSTPILCFYTKNNKYDMGIMIQYSQSV